MYIEISEYFYLFDVDISYLFEYLNMVILIEDVKISWEINYAMTKNLLKSVLVRFMGVFAPNRDCTLLIKTGVYVHVDWWHIFNAKRRLWKEHYGFGLKIVKFELLINIFITKFDHFYYAPMFSEFVLIKEVLMDNAHLLEYADIMGEFLDELALCINIQIMSRKYVGFFDVFLLSFIDIMSYKQSFIIIFVLYIIYNVFLSSIYLSFFFLKNKFRFLKYDYIFSKDFFFRSNLISYFTFIAHFVKSKRKLKFQKKLTVHILKYRELYYLLALVDKFILFFEKLVKFDSDFYYFFILLNYFYIIKKYVLQIFFIFVNIPLKFIKYIIIYIYLEIYKI
jgi:hypothetical protein